MSEKTTFNTCMGNGCHAGCIHLTHVKDGRIVKVERTIYPDGEEGIICTKGVAGARLPYHPDRLKYPLKRGSMHCFIMRQKQFLLNLIIMQIY